MAEYLSPESALLRQSTAEFCDECKQFGSALASSLGFAPDRRHRRHDIGIAIDMYSSLRSMITSAANDCPSCKFMDSSKIASLVFLHLSPSLIPAVLEIFRVTSYYANPSKEGNMTPFWIVVDGRFKNLFFRRELCITAGNSSFGAARPNIALRPNRRWIMIYAHFHLRSTR